MEKTVMLETMGSSRKDGRPNVRRIDNIKEAVGVSLQELSRAGEDRTVWTSVMHSVPEVGVHVKHTHTHTHTCMLYSLFPENTHKKARVIPNHSPNRTGDSLGRRLPPY